MLNAFVIALDGLLQGHEDSVVSVEFTPDGRWIGSVSHDKTCKVSIKKFFVAATAKNKYFPQNYNNALFVRFEIWANDWPKIQRSLLT